MGFIGKAIGSVIGGVTGSAAAAKGAQAAAKTQASAADAAIAEQRAARLSNEQLQDPFVQAGRSSLAQQMSLIGLNGTTNQQTAMDGLLAGPEYTTGVRQGEEAILQNAAATGGLRGGNTQNSLANFRTDLLGTVFANQVNRLGGLTSLGQNAAAGVGNAGIASASGIAGLYQQQGAALAGGQLAAGNSQMAGFNSAIGLGGLLVGSGIFKGKVAPPASRPVVAF